MNLKILFSKDKIKSDIQCLWRRFPVTVVFTMLLSVWMCFERAWQGDILANFIIFGMEAILLSMTLALWKQTNPLSGKYFAVYCISFLFITALLVLGLTSYYSSQIIDCAHISIFVMLIVALMTQPLIRRADEEQTWKYILYNLMWVSLAGFIGQLLMGAWFALYYFFSKLILCGETSNNVSRVISVVTIFTIPLLLWLIKMPGADEKLEFRQSVTNFIGKTIKYLMMPVMTCYLIVAYVYILKIIITWQLPDGTLSYMVSAMVLGYLGLYVLNYGCRRQEQNRFEVSFWRYIPYLLLLPVLVMSIGIVRRFLDYGLTAPRLYILTLNLWFYFVCIVLIVTKGKRFRWIFVSFATVFFLTSALPVNYTSIAANYMYSSLKKEVSSITKGKLPIDYAQLNSILETKDDETSSRIREEIMIVNRSMGTEKLKTLISNYDSNITPDYNKTMSKTYEWSRDEQFDGKSIILPKGYSKMLIDCKFVYSDSKKCFVECCGSNDNEQTINLTPEKVYNLLIGQKKEILLNCSDGSALLPMSLENDFYGSGKYSLIGVVFMK